MPTFRVTPKTMPAQTTRTGRIKTDINGDPLQSVQLIQSPEQKKEMLQIMLDLSQVYAEFPELFPEDAVQLGLDPRAYTPEEMFVDFLERYQKWRMISTNHLYESFIIRHNWLMEQMMERLHQLEMYDEIKDASEKFPIRLRFPKHEAISRALKTSAVFDTPE